MSGRQPCFSASSVMYFSMAPIVDRAEAVVQRAGALAQAVLRADAAADFRQRVGLVRQLRGLEQLAFLDQPQPVRDVVVHRALPLAVRIAAGEAAAGLAARHPRRRTSRRSRRSAGMRTSRRLLRRVAARHFEELQGCLSTMLTPPACSESDQRAEFAPPSASPARTCRGRSRKSSRIASPHSLPVTLDVLRDQRRADAAGGFHALRRDAVDVDQLVVVAVDEVAIEIEHVGEAAGEARAEVEAGAAEHDRPRRRSCIRSSGRPRLRSTAIAPELRTAKRSPARPAANNSPPVAPYRQVLPMIDRVLRRVAPHRRAAACTMRAAGHALADVVVGVAFELEVQAAGVPRAEALAGGARAAAMSTGASCHAVVAVTRARSRRTGARRSSGR